MESGSYIRRRGFSVSLSAMGEGCVPSLVLLAVSTSSHSHERPHEGHSRRGVCRCALYPSSVDDDGDVVMHEEDCSFLNHHLNASLNTSLDEEVH